MIWPFRKKKLVKPFAYVKNEWDFVRDIVERDRPELLAEYPPVTEPVSALGAFLNRHYPIDGGWGARSVCNASRDLERLIAGRT